ncbi:MAG: amino acid adenylation domain-containing protein [Acidobacteriota bacterium]|nr:amino acid adenylation domain-containing protein [Acidobacteriota bacterium]
MAQKVTAEDLARLDPEQRALYLQLLQQARGRRPARAEQVEAEESLTIPRRPEAEHWVLSPDQERLWLLHQLDPDSPAYHFAHPSYFQTRLDYPALVRSLREIRRRHEAWRTRFPAVDGRPVQVVESDPSLPLPVIDLRRVFRPGRESLVLALADVHRCQRFDLQRGPVMRTALVWLSEDEFMLLLTLHHIVADYLTMGKFWYELRTLYDAFSQGRPSPLPELRRQFADFAVWQRRRLETGDLEPDLAYWRQKLEDVPLILELPTDHPRPKIQRLVGTRSSLRVAAEPAEGLRRLARRHQASNFMILAALFQIVLMRFSGREKVLFGLPSSNRPVPETEPMLGFFLNQLMICTDLAGDPPFLEALARCRRASLEAYEHQDVSFHQLLEELRPVRDPSRPPGVQVTFFILETQSELEEQLHPLQNTDLDEGVAREDLTFFLWDHPQGFHGWFEYATDLFDATTIQRLGEHFRCLVDSVLAAPEERLSRLSGLRPGQRHQILVEWNRTPPASASPSLPELFRQRVAAVPEATAVIHGGDFLSFRELAAWVDDLTRRLAAAGVGPEEPVAVWTSRSPALVAAFLALLQGGGVYLPLDPEHPPERSRRVLDDSGTRVMLTATEELPPELGAGLRILSLAPPTAGGSGPSLSAASEPVGIHDLDRVTHLIYTSGSTGRPKGVAGTQRQLLARLGWVWRAHPFAAGPSGEQEVCAQKTPMSFVDSLWELLGAVLQGVPTVILPTEEVRDPLALVDRLAEHGISRLWLVPTLLRSMLDGVPDLRRRLPRLGLWVSSGEALPADLLERFEERMPGAVLLNLYGASEAWDAACYDPRSDDGRWRVPVGRPLDGVRLMVLSPQDEVQPLGVGGQIWVSGEVLARGYWRRPGFTAERFRPDPLGPPGSRRYATGDLGAWRRDGQMLYLRRCDHQVKIRGFRIEPREVETALMGHPAVQDCVVVAQEEALGGGGERPAGGARLVAYVVLRRQVEGLLGELRRHLQQRLPEYMVPAFFTVLDELPLNPSGKVDRSALPSHGAERPELSTGYVAPVTPLEHALCEIWEQVLGVERVGVYDDFFALGGDSVLGVQVAARATEAGLKVVPRQIFEYPNVAELAAACGAGGEGAEQGMVVGAAELTPAQREFFDRRPADLHHNNLPLLLEVPASVDGAPLDRRLLASALEHVLIHHDGLRASFLRLEEPSSSELPSEGWRQEIAGAEGARVEVPLWDLRRLRREHRGPALDTLCGMLQSGFDLQRPPLVRLALVRWDEDGALRLFLTAHHLVIDGVGLTLLVQDLQRAYGQLAAGTPVHLPPKTESVAAWSESWRALAGSSEVQEQKEHWLALTSAGVAGPVPDHVGGAGTAASEAVLETELPAEVTEALIKEVPASHRLGVDEVLLAALARAWRRVSGTPRLLVEVESHAAQTVAGAGLQRTVGWLSFSYPVLLDLEGAEGTEEELRRVKRSLRRDPHGGLSYAALRWAAEDPDLRKRLAAIEPVLGFAYLGHQGEPALAAQDGAPEPGQAFRPASEPSGAPRSPRQRLHPEVAVEAQVEGGRLRVSWSYPRDRYERATLEALAAALETEAGALVEHCRNAGAGELAPEDLNLLELDQETLDSILSKADLDEL